MIRDEFCTKLMGLARYAANGYVETEVAGESRGQVAKCWYRVASVHIVGPLQQYYEWQEVYGAGTG